MSSVIEERSSAAVENGDLREMEGRLDQLADLIGPSVDCGVDCGVDCDVNCDEESSFPQTFSLANYRREIAKTIDEVLAETEMWWFPDRA
jgi:hypothetical protein